MRNPFTLLYELEFLFYEWTQYRLKFGEPLWLFLSEYVTPAYMSDVLVPIVGVFHHKLLIRLVYSLGIINVLSSLFKWLFPESRPYWWGHEHYYVNATHGPMQFPLTCETSAGFPSSHAMVFTNVAYLLIVFMLTYVARRFKFRKPSWFVEVGSQLVVSMAAISMSLSRIYLGTQFLHQCLLSSMAAIVLLHLFDYCSTRLYMTRKFRACVYCLLLALLPIMHYFGMKLVDCDPHWSVRMAFKWCSDPHWLRHESSPVFILCRDFGYLMGIALSAPIYKRHDSKPMRAMKRAPLIFALEMLNYWARLSRPKDYGRFVFVAYEFLRNLMHAYSLLTLLSKIKY